MQIIFISAVRLERFVVRAESLLLSVYDLSMFAASIKELYFCGDYEFCLVNAALLSRHLAVKLRARPWGPTRQKCASRLMRTGTCSKMPAAAGAAIKVLGLDEM